MEKTLENLCKKKLKISEKVSTREIINFASERNYEWRTIFLLNFKENKIYSLCEDIERGKYEILGFELNLGKYGFYYTMYCRKNDSYLKIYSNTKLKKELDFWAKDMQGIHGIFVFKNKFFFSVEEMDYYNGRKYRRIN